MRASTQGVLPTNVLEPRIADHGAIGAGRSVALVSRRGAISWWCPGRFDAPSVFASILDASRGGEFRASPVDERATSAFAYVPDTNVLATTHEVEGVGRVRVTDLVPFDADVGLGEDIIVRRIEGVEGALELDVRFAPRFQYGAVLPRITQTPAGLLARGAGELLLLSGVPFAEGRIVVRAGERVDLVLRHAPYDAPVPFARALPLLVDELETRTLARWRAWSARTRAPAGPDGALVRRAALALKLLQDERTGAIIAAPTTSLPEELGGVRNWDYRYAWVRDGALCAEALAAIGHEDEADAFARWLERTLAEGELRVLYSVAGRRELPERVLSHLSGYRGSAPVRVGNEAATQRQLDVAGELFHFAAGHLAPSESLATLADQVAATWRESDSGIWEVRCEPKHFVLSKAMASLALDKAASMMPDHANAARWRAEADAARALVLADGYDAETDTFVQAIGAERHVDASNLLLAITGFLDARDPRMLGTTARIRERLMTNGLVYRYLDADDGVSGDEATFAYCTFWLVEVLARQGNASEARAIFDGLTARATSLGLYAEEIDAATGEHLGNFPQGFPHAGLISAAIALEKAEAEDEA